MAPPGFCWHFDLIFCEPSLFGLSYHIREMQLSAEPPRFSLHDDVKQHSVNLLQAIIECHGKIFIIYLICF